MTARARGRVLFAFRMALTLLLAALALNAWNFLKWSSAAVRYPFELNYGEGQILTQCVAFQRGDGWYQPFDPERPVVWNYPPGYQLACLAVLPVTGRLIEAGRIVSFVSTLLIVLLITVVASRVTKCRSRSRDSGIPPTADRLLPGLLAGLAFLGTWPAFFCGPLMRIDMLALMLSLSGLALYLRWPSSRPVDLPVALLFVLAAFTRQTDLSAAAATALSIFVTDRRRGIRFVLMMALLASSLFVLAQATSHGGFFFHVVMNNIATYRIQDALALLAYPFQAHFGLTLLACLWFVTVLRERTTLPLPNRDPATLTLPLFFVFAFLLAFTAGRVGSDLNYLLEILAAACIGMGAMVGRTLGELRGWAASVPHGTWGFPPPYLALVVAVVLAAQISWPQRVPALSYHFAPEFHEDTAACEEALRRIAQTSLPVLSEDMTLLVLSGRPIEWQPFEMTRMAERGAWDEGNLTRRLDRQGFGLVILHFPVERPGPIELDRFSARVRRAISADYKAAGHAGGYYFYEPLGESR